VLGKNSLTRTTIIKMGIRIAIVIIAVTLISYWHVVSILESQTLEQLKKYIVERGQRESQVFLLAQDNHLIFKKEFERRIELLGSENPQQRFDQLLLPCSDKTLRNFPQNKNLELFDTKHDSGIYIGKQAVITPKLRRDVLTFYDLLNSYGPAWINRFINTYVITPDNIVILYWPDEPWALQASADIYMPDEVAYASSNIKNNPTRQQVWTSLYIDPVAKLWMVSLETPIDDKDNKQIAAIGHDIVLNELMDRTIHDALDGTYNMIFREDGRIIAHPSYMDKILKANGEFDIQHSEDQALLNTFNLVKNRDSNTIVIDNKANDEYLAITKIEGPNWYFVTAYPKSLMSNLAFDTARFILFLGLLSLLIEIIILYYVLRKQVTKPLREFAGAIENISSGNFTTKATQYLPVSRKDEIGTLAKSFDSMAGQLNSFFEELKHLDKLKDEFLANTSHELRTPLNGIIGLAESLIDGVSGDLPDKTKQNLYMIVTSGKRLSVLVNEILDFSQLKHKQLDLQLKSVPLREIVELVFMLSQPLIVNKSVKLINKIAADLPPALADENRLQQILHNLIGNAMKFTETGSIEVSATVDEKQLIITVADTGIGIAADKLNTIFESFEQADSGTARKYGGTGLGLAVTKQLVELHGGKIWVKSREAIGSKFIFSLNISTQQVSIANYQLPKLKADIYSSIKTQDHNLNTNKENQILIVDDETINLQVLSNYLSLQNYNVIQVTSGIEALARIEKGLKPDAIILDVMMPQMTGYEVTRKLRQKWAALELPILLLTAKTQIEDLVIGLESGANDYLTKPISKQELLARLKTHISLSQFKAQNLKLEVEKQAAELANQAKSQFLATMSHELRTPLNGILGYAQILKRDLNLEPRQQKGLKIIEQSGEHLLTLINDVLDLAKIESGKIELDNNEFALVFFLKSLTEIVQIRAEHKDIYFQLVTESLPNGVYGDEKRLRQVLINLLGNAIKFTDKGGVTFKVSPYDTKIRFEIADTGVGIASEELQTIFEPFQQVGDKQRQIQGTGLGLAISRQLVEVMGGQLQVKSQLGQGTTFWFDLQLPKAKNIIQPDKKLIDIEKIIGIKGEVPTIIIVDDKTDNRQILIELLAPLGFKLIEATDGIDGLNKALKHHPQLIITDLIMPNMDGFQFIRKIRQTPQLKNIKIFASSASVFEEDCKKSLTAGCNLFLPKPIKAEYLFEQLQKFFNIEWIYPQTADTNNKHAPIIPPPLETINELFELSLAGDIEAIEEQIKQLIKSDTRFIPFANKLHSFSKNFQINKMCDWLNGYLK
jgi:signal transduction histidine kinase